MVPLNDTNRTGPESDRVERKRLGGPPDLIPPSYPCPSYVLTFIEGGGNRIQPDSN